MSVTKQNGKAARQAGIELLRCIAMLMVITLHYLDKGGVLIPLSQKQSPAGYAAWLLEAFCIVAVNVYVLVSGYFLTESGFKLKRFIVLAGQILFYSLLIPLALILCGKLSVSELTLYDFLFYLLPVQMKHYWFGTAYILMYLFVPVLSAGVKQLSEKQLRGMICLLILVISVAKSDLPFQLAIDNEGYDVVWFLCLFLIAAYFRLYGCNGMKKSGRGWLLYAAGSCGIFLLSLLIAYFSNRFGKFAYFIGSPYHYNHILCLLAAVGLFFAFLHWDIPEGLFAKVVRRIAPYTFGVYLLHENAAVKFLWPELMGMSESMAGNLSPLHWIRTILLIFTVGIFVDFGRSLLFAGIGKLFVRRK